jgi:hypothetical protein
MSTNAENYWDGDWYSGALNDLNVRAAPNTSIAAIQWNDTDGHHIRVYCQGMETKSIS